MSSFGNNYFYFPGQQFVRKIKLHRILCAKKATFFTLVLTTLAVSSAM